jgi:hypothetical protein
MGAFAAGAPLVSHGARRPRMGLQNPPRRSRRDTERARIVRDLEERDVRAHR